jgi:hypothetical protein
MKMINILRTVGDIIFLLVYNNNEKYSNLYKNVININYKILNIFN